MNWHDPRGLPGRIICINCNVPLGSTTWRITEMENCLHSHVPDGSIDRWYCGLNGGLSFRLSFEPLTLPNSSFSDALQSGELVLLKLSRQKCGSRCLRMSGICKNFHSGQRSISIDHLPRGSLLQGDGSLQRPNQLVLEIISLLLRELGSCHVVQHGFLSATYSFPDLCILLSKPKQD